MARRTSGKNVFPSEKSTLVFELKTEADMKIGFEIAPFDQIFVLGIFFCSSKYIHSINLVNL